jgi:hypothetical protein
LSHLLISPISSGDPVKVSVKAKSNLRTMEAIQTPKFEASGLGSLFGLKNFLFAFFYNNFG